MIDKIGAIIIDGARMLVAREKGLDIFFIPGGKRHGDESDLETLEREVKEELGAGIKDPEYFRTFTVRNHDNTDDVRVKAYFVDLDGEAQPTSEIEELLWVDRIDYVKYNLGNVLKILIPELMKEGYL